MWQALHAKGHEIANHTRNHRNFRDLTEEEIIAEVSSGLADILANIEGMRFVPSFTYPYGSNSEMSRNIVSNYHMNARGSPGINPRTPPDFMLIKGCGYYEPFVVTEMNRNLDCALASGGWYVPYFHAISDGPPAHCPIEVFQRHLDYIAEHEDSLWIAPQGMVARYIREREAFRCKIVDEGGFWLCVDTGLDPALYDIPLTVRIFGSPGHGDLCLVIGGEAVQMPADAFSVLVDLIPETVQRISVYLVETTNAEKR